MIHIRQVNASAAPIGIRQECIFSGRNRLSEPGIKEQWKEVHCSALVMLDAPYNWTSYDGLIMSTYQRASDALSDTQAQISNSNKPSRPPGSPMTLSYGDFSLLFKIQVLR